MEDGDQRTRSYARVTYRLVKKQQNLKEEKADVRMFEKYAEMLEKEYKKLILNPHAETMETRRKCRIRY